jgi:hypothetical protein
MTETCRSLSLMPALLLLCGVCFLSASPARGQAPQPIPGEQTQREAKRLVNEVYADLLEARTDDERVASARVLIMRAAETNNAPAAKYVMYETARELAVEAGDTEAAMDAIDGLREAFAGGFFDVASASLRDLSRQAKTEGQHAAVARATIGTAERMIAAERYDDAATLLARVRSSAFRSKRPELVSAFKELPEQLRLIRGEAERIADDLQAIEAKPDDPELSLSVGRFFALYRGDWEAGLPLLAQSSDEALAAAAKADLEGASEPAPQIAIGDRWWSLAAEHSGIEQEALAERARQWYRFALPATAGIERSALVNRLSPAGEVKWGDLVLEPGIRTAIEVDGQSDALREGPDAPSANWAFKKVPAGAKRQIKLHFDGYLYFPRTAEIGLKTLTRASSISVEVNGRPALSGNGHCEAPVKLVKGYNAIRGSITVAVTYIKRNRVPSAEISLSELDGQPIAIPADHWFHDAAR